MPNGLFTSDAADATQAFFVRLLEKDYLKDADPDRGRFRSFLLTAFKRFLSKERDFTRALKRGGGLVVRSLNISDAESKYGLEPGVAETAETLFERKWALTLLDRVLELLESEYRTKGRSDFFAACRGALIGIGAEEQYAVIARTPVAACTDHLHSAAAPLDSGVAVHVAGICVVFVNAQPSGRVEQLFFLERSDNGAKRLRP